jgi:hypothetical protein
MLIKGLSDQAKKSHKICTQIEKIFMIQQNKL